MHRGRRGGRWTGCRRVSPAVGPTPAGVASNGAKCEGLRPLPHELSGAQGGIRRSRVCPEHCWVADVVGRTLSLAAARLLRRVHLGHGATAGSSRQWATASLCVRNLGSARFGSRTRPAVRRVLAVYDAARNGRADRHPDCFPAQSPGAASFHAHSETTRAGDGALRVFGCKTCPRFAAVRAARRVTCCHLSSNVTWSLSCPRVSVPVRKCLLTCGFSLPKQTYAGPIPATRSHHPSRVSSQQQNVMATAMGVATLG